MRGSGELRALILAIAMVASSAGCTATNGEQLMPITIRVENQANRTLFGAELGHGGNPSATVAPQLLGDIRPGETSDPVNVPINQADYRRLGALVDGRAYSFFSFDFTEHFGAEDLPAGNYKFVVVAIDDNDRLLSVDIVEVG